MAIIKHSRKIKNSKKRSIFYEAQVYVRGIRVAIKTFETQAEAAKWHDETKRQYVSGQVTNKVAAMMNFGEVFERYKLEYVTTLRPQSQQSAVSRYPYLAESPLTKISMCDFTDRTIDGWIAWLIKQPTARNPGRKSFMQEFKLLSSVLHWYRDCMNAQFVVPIVKRHRKAVYYKPVKARRPDYFMRREEIQAWITWLKEHRTNPNYYRLATFMVLTATRVGEAAGLFWDAVDFENSIVSIVRTVWWDHHTRRPNIQELAKTEESIRIIKLPPQVLQMLKEMQKESGGRGAVFTKRRGGIFMYSAIQNAFNAGFIALGLPWRSTHICRHSFGTLALVATRDLSSVQATMGHKNVRETEGYAKVAALLDGSTVTKTAEFIGLDLGLKKDAPMPSCSSDNA